MTSHPPPGTIAGVWPGKGLLNRTGSEQAAALITQYGPKVTMALAIAGWACATQAPVCVELTMLRSEWVVSRTKLNIATQAKTFAPGNLRATADNVEYARFVF
jgi:sedoheptulose-bisphosphatase